MKESWLAIIIQIILCALCPFLLIPFWIICSIIDKYESITAQSTISTIFLIAIGCIAVVSPIITIVNIVRDGIASAFDSFGIGFAVIIFEIHFSLRYLWKTKIKKKLGVESSKPHKSICNNHQGLFCACALGFCVLFFVLLLSGINMFFPFLVAIYGFAFLFWDLSAQ